MEEKKNWFKRHWIVSAILGFFIFLIVLGAFSENENNTGNSGSSYDKNSGVPIETTKPSNDFCDITNIRQVVPDRIDCIMENGACGPKLQSSGAPVNTYKWADGIPLGFVYAFDKGYRTGENVNYLFSRGRLMHSVTPVNQDGTIGEKVNYEIDLAIDPKDKTNEGYKIVQYRCCYLYCTDENYLNFN